MKYSALYVCDENVFYIVLSQSVIKIEQCSGNSVVIMLLIYRLKIVKTKAKISIVPTSIH